MRAVLSAILMMTGSVFVFLAAVGVVRMPDLYMRLSTAANNAFESYVDAVEMQNAAQIAALAPQALTPTGPGAEVAQSLGADLSTYGLSPAGMPKLINASQMAPFLALNIMA